MFSTALRFIWANLTRRALRSVVTAGGVAIAVAAVFSLVSFQRGYQQGLRADLDRLGAHLLVVPKGCPYDAASLALHGASWPCYLKSAYLETVAQTPHVTAAAPVLMNALYLPKTGEQAVYCGVEQNIVQLKRQWHIDGAMCTAHGDLLVGSEAARLHRWRLGQTVSLPGLPTAQGRIAGILQPTQGADDLFVYMPLGDAQRIFARPQQLTHILVRLDQPESLDEVVTNLRGCEAGMDMNIVPLTHLFQSIQSLIESTRLLLGCVALVAVLGAGAGLSNTILMAVNERTREIGVMRALGGSQAQIFTLVWSETMALCLVGGAAGILLSLLSARALDSWLRQSLPFAPHDALIRPELDLILACLIAAPLLGTLASLFPASRAARLSPALAIRTSGGDL